MTVCGNKMQRRGFPGSPGECLAAVRMLFVACLLVVAQACAEQTDNAPEAANPPDHPDSELQLAAANTASGVPGIVGERYVAGEHYDVLPNPVETSDPERIEVVEVFWYGCSHCYTFEPLVKAWEKTIADDVLFVQIPAIWDPDGIMQHHATVFYAAQALGVLDQISGDVFALLAKDRKVTDQQAFIRIFERHGVAEQKYLDAFSAWGTQQKVKRARKIVRKDYRVQGTPELIVNGKYRVSGRKAGGHKGMLEVVDFLIKKERTEA